MSTHNDCGFNNVLWIEFVFLQNAFSSGLFVLLICSLNCELSIYSKWLKRQFCFKICCIISVLQSSDDDWDTEESSRSGEMTFMWECEVNKSKLWILFCLNLRHFFSWITVMNFVSIFPEVCFTNKKPLFVFALSLCLSLVSLSLFLFLPCSILSQLLIFTGEDTANKTWIVLNNSSLNWKRHRKTGCTDGRSVKQAELKDYESGTILRWHHSHCQHDSVMTLL